MEIVPFAYKDVRLKESCWIDRKPYFTRKAIGEWLEYKKPQKAIDKIVERNPHISDPRWAVTVKLTATDGKEYDTEVYDPIGLQLIVMESRQPKAIAYKIAVAHLVWAYMNGELKRSKTIERKEIPKPVCPLTGLPVWTPERKEALLRIAKEKGLKKSAIYEHAKKLMNGEPRYKGRKRTETYIKENYDRLYEIYILRYQYRLKLREIKERLGLSIQTICKWLKYFKSERSLKGNGHVSQM